MTGPMPLTATSWLTAWTADLPVLVLVGLLTAAYLRLAHRHGHWPAARTGSFLAAMAVVVVATCSFLGVYAHTLFWALAAQDVLLVALAPVPLVLSRPLQLVRGPRPVGPRRPAALLGLLLPIGFLVAIYTTGLDTQRLLHHGLFVGVQIALVAAGGAVAGPLFAERGATYGVRALAAFVDGLLDAVPGLVVLASHGRIAAAYYAHHAPPWAPSLSTDQQIGGSLMVALGELVGLPAILLLLVQWVRSDARDAGLADLALDAADGDATGTQRPWWETDPGPLAERLAREDR